MFACHRVAVSDRVRSHAVFLLALALAAGRAAAEEIAVAAPEQILTAQAGMSKPLIELSSSEVPRFDDASIHTSRTKLTLFPAGRSLVGLSVGVTSSAGPPSIVLPPYTPGGPMFDLGLHWRHEMDGNYRLDVTAWRRVGNVDAMSLIQSRDPNFGARVEMGFASGRQGPRAGFVADRGFIGVQLDGGARVTVKRSGGRPMLYYRNTF